MLPDTNRILTLLFSTPYLQRVHEGEVQVGTPNIKLNYSQSNPPHSQSNLPQFHLYFVSIQLCTSRFHVLFFLGSSTIIYTFVFVWFFARTVTTYNLVVAIQPCDTIFIIKNLSDTLFFCYNVSLIY